MQKQNTPEVETLFVKSLLLTAGQNELKIKGNLFIGLKGPLSKCDRKEIITFCLRNKLDDVALLLGLESDQMDLVKNITIEKCSEFV